MDRGEPEDDADAAAAIDDDTAAAVVVDDDERSSSSSGLFCWYRYDPQLSRSTSMTVTSLSSCRVESTDEVLLMACVRRCVGMAC